MLNNKRIAHNTIILYIRMAFLMTISLYTSRITLQALGISNFGIYNIVGGIIVLFSFINNSLTSATRRFLNYHIGTGDLSQLNKVFASMITVHVFIACIVFILCETLGLWILNTQLNIPLERMYAANFVYQMSILSAFISIIFSPYEGAIAAEEHFSIYAIISIIEALSKLIIVFFLFVTPFDRLVTFSFALFVNSFLLIIVKCFYCRKNFSYCRFRFSLEKERINPLLSFSGWSLLGQIANIGYTTGVNMIINLFLGVTVNAAVGVSQQINSAIYNLVSNFQMAFNPQLVQTYASGDKNGHAQILSFATRASFFLLFIIAIPILFNIRFILNLWLVEVPNYTQAFATLIIIFSLIEAIGAPLWMSIQAKGNIRNYQIIVSSINILNVPLAYLLLQKGFSPICVFVGQVGIGVVLFIFRMCYILPLFNISRLTYFKENLQPIMLISLITSSCMFIIIGLFNDAFIRLLMVSISSVLITGTLIYFLGLTSHEKFFVKKRIYLASLRVRSKINDA